MSGGRTFLPLSGPQHFDAVFRGGKRARCGGITIVAAARDQGPPRVGLVASRRVGGAVVRNRAKRRLRAVLDRAELIEGFDYVLIASSVTATASFDALERWVTEAMARATASTAGE